MLPDILSRVRNVENLPSLPPVALEIIQLTRAEDVPIERLAGVIQNDPAISAQLLRLVNSPVAGLSCEVRSINQAVTLMGFRSVRAMALGFAITGAVNQCTSHGFDLERFWRDSVTSAVAARSLARLHQPALADEAFLAGLLCDIGRLALCQIAPDAYRAIVETAANTGVSLAETESHLLGMTHARLGGELLAAWGLPEPIAVAVRAHHGEELALLDGDNLALANAVYCATAVAELFSGTQSDVLKVQALCLERLAVDEHDFSQVLARIEPQVRQTAEVLSVGVGELPSYEQLAAKLLELDATGDVATAPATEHWEES